MASHRRASAAILILLALLPRLAPAQIATRGRISGIVRDATGAVVPNAEIAATDLDSRRTWSTTTNDIGAYTFPFLPPGTYRLTAAHSGFKMFVAAPVMVNEGDNLALDVPLVIGDVNDTIDVAAAPGYTNTAAGRFTIESRDAQTLPAIGGNYLALALLTPGASTPVPSFAGTGTRTFGDMRPTFNGHRREANNFQLDGVDNNETTDNLIAYLPSVDAIEHVQVTTNYAPAEFGNYQGGIVGVTLKSGTNNFHGTASEFFRNEMLRATNWADARWGRPDPLNPGKPRMSHNVFGVTAGGPIVSGRMFFFADYAGTRRTDGPQQSLISVVPAAMRDGDFSQLLQGPNPQQLYDPLTTRPDPAHPGAWIRDPFPGNQIPLTRINAVAAALFASPFYPHPALPGIGSNAYVGQLALVKNDQLDVKIDGRPTSRDDVVVRYAYGMQRTDTRNTNSILSGAFSRSPFHGALAQWNRQLGGRAYNEARFGFNRSILRAGDNVDVERVGNLGEAFGIRGANRRVAGLPAISFEMGVGASGVFQSFSTDTFQYQDDALWQIGRHAVRAGGLALRYHEDVYFSGNNGQLGNIVFNGQYSRDLSNPSSTGSAVADFVLGYPSRLARGDYAAPWGQRNTLWAGFVQDDWRASDAVTVNVGLRYEYRTPFVEVHDRQVNFDLKTGRMLIAGRDGNSRGLYDPYKNDWQPRVGVAWNPRVSNRQFVLRGAYGISSYLEGTGTNLRLTMNPPFFNEFETINDATSLPPPITAGFDSLREKDPLVGTILRAWDPQHRPSRSQQWNGTIETQLPGHVTVSGSYVGQFATNLVVPVNFNQRISPSDPRPFDKMFPQIGTVILTTPNADHRYNGLQAMGQRRMTDGWTVLSSYAWGKAMSHGRGFFSEGGQSASQPAFWPNPHDRNADWGATPFDVRHNLTLATYGELPFGEGRRWLAPSWLRPVASGWSISAILRAHTGFPVTVSAPDQSLTGARAGRPDQSAIGNDPHGVGPDALWFDTSVFALPRLGTFGNAKVGSIRGPGLRVIDVSAARRVSLSGGRALEFRADVFNVLNTPVFNAPDRSITSRTFGHVLSTQLEREMQLVAKILF